MEGAGSAIILPFSSFHHCQSKGSTTKPTPNNKRKKQVMKAQLFGFMLHWNLTDL
jgi:hypothetical protein